MEITFRELSQHPFHRYNKKGYMKFECCGARITLEQAASKVGLTVELVGLFNFGKDDDYNRCFKVWPEGQWQENEEDFPGISGWLGSWFWVPGDSQLPPGSPPNEGKLVGPVKIEETEEERQAREDADRRQATVDALPETMAEACAPRPEQFFAARSQTDGVWASATVDCGIEAGDILFSHHAPDDFISHMTVTWMTHAGIALNSFGAVDADNRRPGFAVAAISTTKFFKQGKPPNYDQHHTTPTGGLVYRYRGRKGDPPKVAEEIRNKAAMWALSQTANKWKFSLESSSIIEEKKEQGKVVKVYHDPKSDKKTRIVEKKFDAKGEAVDEKGNRLQFYSRKSREYQDTPFQTIYCAELVWRAYRAAGVNVVDPKKFFNLYEDDDRGIAGCLAFRIEPERYGAEFKQGKDGYGISPTASRIRAGFEGVKGRLAKMAPNSVLRKKVLSFMKTQNSGFLCAPYQLAASPLCERLAQLEPVKLKFKAIEIPDFHGANLNPLEVVNTLCAGSTEAQFQKAWRDFTNEKAKKVTLSYKKPWADCDHPDAPKLELKPEDYNKAVDMSSASEKPPFMD